VKEVLGAIWEGLKTIARAWGRVVNTVLLSIVYFTLFGITALIAMVAGQDLLDMRPRPTGGLSHERRQGSCCCRRGTLHPQET